MERAVRSAWRKLRTPARSRKWRKAAGYLRRMLKRYRTHLLLGLLAFLAAQAWNRWNLAVMMRIPEARGGMIDGRVVKAVDDASYLVPVDEWLGDRPDKAAETLRHRPDLRPPGYRIWYLLPRLVLDPLPALSAITLLQCLLYAFAVMLLWETLLAQGIGGRTRWCLVLPFAVLPAFHGFLFHTLTEGVTPSIGLIVVCSALHAQAGSRLWLLIGLVMWSLLMVTRPALLWVGLALLPALRTQRPAHAIASVLLASLPMLGWWTTNMIRARGFVGLHPIYRADEPGINRPTHGAFWNLAKSWGARGDAFHPVMEDAFQAALRCDTSASEAGRFLVLAPGGTITKEQEASIASAFMAWERFNCAALAPALKSPQGTVPFTTNAEQRIIAQLEAVTSEWRSQHFFHHHIRVPLRVLKELVAHSNLNLWLFQHHLRGQPLMEALRWLSALVHVLLICAVPLVVLLPVPAPVRWTAIGACAYLIYLAYVQRGVEERYTLPVLFIGVVCAAFVVGRRDAEAQRTQ